MTAAFRLLLLPAYVVLAHLAEARESPTLALIALVDLALLVLIEGLVARRAAAWLGAAGAALALAGSAGWEQPVATASKTMADTAVTPRRRN